MSSSRSALPDGPYKVALIIERQRIERQLARTQTALLAVGRYGDPAQLAWAQYRYDEALAELVENGRQLKIGLPPEVRPAP